jgi:7-carboxy-7-deazaguanine synthase
LTDEPLRARDRIRGLSWEEARGRSLRVNEIFHSIQGEGSRAGLPTAFLRLTGCALRCSWCDTERAFYQGERLRLEEIEDRLSATGCPLVEITGGEPLLQPAVYPLMRRLLARRGRTVLVETGGDQDIGTLPEGVVAILDVKCPGSGMHERMDLGNLERLRSGDELKFVLADRRDYDYAREVLREHRIDGGPLVSFAPVHGVLDPALLAAWILEDGLEVRLQLQLHKLLWPGEERGR